MVPLRKEAAFDYHRMCSKIYCLDSDGGKGEYASKEMIQTHEGLFGMELQMWERIRDQNLDYADKDFGAFQEPMSVIDQDDALINDRSYKRKYEPEEAIQMISNGECGAFSNQLMQCFQEAAKQQNWLKRQN